MSRIYSVAFAEADVEGLLGATEEAFLQALVASWVAGTAVTRYGRTWRIERPRIAQGVWVGRIGFVEEGELTRIRWDPENQMFITEEVSGGHLVPFALHSSSHRIAFQLIGGVVRPTTFTGALQTLFNTQGTYRWRVRPLVRQLSYEQWRESVKEVTEFSFRLEVPNPHYEDEPEVESLLEDLRVQVARLSGKARAGGVINTSVPLFQQALDHVRRQHGRAVLRGRDENEEESEWDSSGGGSVPVRTRVESEEETTLPEEELRRVLADQGERLQETQPGEPGEDETP